MAPHRFQQCPRAPTIGIQWGVRPDGYAPDSAGPPALLFFPRIPAKLQVTLVLLAGQPDAEMRLLSNEPHLKMRIIASPDPEQRIGHTLRKDCSLASVQQKLARGAGITRVPDWQM